MAKLVKRCLRAALALSCVWLVVVAASVALGEERGIISEPVLLYLDGTMIIGANGDDSLTDINGNGLIEVLPGDVIIINGTTNEVPYLPGYPAGLPYEFDPAGPTLSGGIPLTTTGLDGTPTGDPSGFPGHNTIDGDDDDIIFSLADPDLAVNGLGYLIVTGNGAAIEHRDASPLEGGGTPAGTVLTWPDVVVRPGSGTELPADHINGDGTIHLVPGNTIDFDNDGLPPWEVPEPGVFDPATRLFYPDSDPENPIIVPPASGPESITGVDGNPVIEGIELDDNFILLSWPDSISNGDYLSEIMAKVLLTDPLWETLKDGQRGVTITEDGALIPRALGSELGGSPGVYQFFRRVVPNHGL